MPTQSFTAVGSHTWTIPSGVTQITITARGAQGGDTEWTSSGAVGKGGLVEGTFSVNSGDTLYVDVGKYPGQSYVGGSVGGGNGGIDSYNGGGGGGASIVNINNTKDLIIAGGGSGTAGSRSGGDGGGLIGADGNTISTATKATGGTQSAGGSGEISDCNGQDGSYKQGGNACATGSFGGSGGGGGYYGGGGGGSNSSNAGTGGGGSSYTDSSATNVSHTQGENLGDGEVIITYTENTAPDAPTNPSPADGATGVTTDTTLSVDVSDPDGDSMDVSFYWDDGTLIETVTGVASGGTATTSALSLSGGTSYSWYAIADDGTATTQSATWSFTTAKSFAVSDSISMTDTETAIRDRSASVSDSIATADTQDTERERNFTAQDSIQLSDNVIVEFPRVIVDVNGTERKILWNSLEVKQQLTNLRDTCKFKIRKGDYIPDYGDEVKVYSQTEEQIFGGTVLRFTETTDAGADTLMYEVEAVDYIYEMDRFLVAETYENQAIDEIITDLLSKYASDFDADGVDSTFEIKKIVFNQIPISECIKKLADIVQYDWYVDYNKSVQFFQNLNKSAPFDITDTSGNYVYKSLKRDVDGSQLVNVVKVRGGTYEADTFTDETTVSGNTTKSFNIAYKMADLAVELDTGTGFVSQSVGTKNLHDFSNYDVLYDFQNQTIEWETPLSSGDVIKYSGKPKVRVLAIADDPDSINAYGTVEKLIRDNSIEDNSTARKRAGAELYAYANKLVDASFYTYQPGLRAGQSIKIESDVRGADNNLVIKTLTFKMIDPNNFGFKAELISSRRNDLISMLSKIMEPDEAKSDEDEVSEKLKTNTEEITISEEHTNVTPEDNNETISIGEDIQKDPFDPANINWVYGYYFPVSDSDVNRMGKFDRDAKWK